MNEKRKETLDVLLHEMAEMREYERTLFAQFGVIISIVALLLAAIPAIFERFPVMPVWVYIVAPVVPSALVAYATLISMLQMLRGRYARSLELRVHKLTGQEGDVLPIPSWDHLQMEVTGQTHSQWYAQANWSFLYVVVALMLLGAVYFSGSRITDTRLFVLALAVDAICLGLPTITLGWVICRGLESWKDTLAILEESLKRTRHEFRDPLKEKRGSERALFSYLLLPRNQEELLKGLFLPICFAIGSWLLLGVVPWKSPFVPHLVGFFFVFEILMYQGRYLLNDVKDRGIDSTGGISKIRFPRSWVFSEDDRDLLSSKEPRETARANFALYAAFASFIGRFVLATLIVGSLFPIDSVRNYRWVEDAMFVMGIFLFATFYEIARSKCSFVDTNKLNEKKLRFWTFMTVLLVGLGYGLRSAAGLWAAGVRGPALLLIFVGGSLFGSSFVALTWAIECTRANVDELGHGKGYLIPFKNSLRKLPEFLEREPVANKPPLQGVQRIKSYWSFYPVLATCGLAAFVFYVLRLPLPGTAYALVMLMIAGGTFIAVKSRVSATIGISVIGFCVSAYLLHKASISVVNSLIGSAILFLPLGTTCAFRRLCYEDLPGVIHRIELGLLLGPKTFYSWFQAKRKMPNAENPTTSSRRAEKVVRSQAAAGSDSR